MYLSNSPSPGSETKTRTGGVVIVSGSKEDRAQMALDLGQLDVEVLTADTGARALQILEHGTQPDIVVLDFDLEDMSGLAVCRFIRARAHLAAVHVIILASAQAISRAKSLDGGADRYIEAPHDPRVLRAAVRAGLRSQAMNRVAMRTARRDAMAWLAMVTAHEINNPLAVVQSNLAYLREAIERGGGGGGGQDMDEASSAIKESIEAVERIRDVTERMQSGDCDLGADLATFNADKLAVHFDQVLEPLPVVAEVDQRWRGCETVRCNLVLLLEAVGAIVEAAMSRCKGPLAVSVHVDDTRVAVLLDFAGAPEEGPEVVLEPSLVDTGDAPSSYEPGLSLLESKLVAQSGQVFANRRGDRWRFGLVLPCDGTSDNEAATKTA